MFSATVIFLTVGQNGQLRIFFISLDNSTPYSRPCVGITHTFSWCSHSDHITLHSSVRNVWVCCVTSCLLPFKSPSPSLLGVPTNSMTLVTQHRRAPPVHPLTLRSAPCSDHSRAVRNLSPASTVTHPGSTFKEDRRGDHAYCHWKSSSSGKTERNHFSAHATLRNIRGTSLNSKASSWSDSVTHLSVLKFLVSPIIPSLNCLLHIWLFFTL